MADLQRHPVRARSTIGVLAILGLLSGANASALPDERSRWHELRSSHFTLLGDADPQTLRAFAARIEALFAAFAALTPGVEVRSPEPIEVLVFRDLDSLRPYSRVRGEAEGQHPTGYFRFTPYGDALVVAATENPSNFEAVFSGALTRLIRATFPRAPAWIETGLSEAYANLTLTPKRVEICRPNLQHIALLRSEAPLPVKDLFATTKRVEFDSTPADVKFSAESWAIVHYLLVSDTALKPKTVQYLELLARGTPAAAAFDQTLGPATGNLDAVLQEYIRRPALTYLAVPLDQLALKLPGELQPLDRRDILYRLGMLLARLHESNRPEAEAHFRAALALDPAHGPSQAGLAWLRSTAKQFEEAAGLFESALAHGGENSRTLLLAARNLLAQAAAARGALDAPAAMPAGVARARRLLERSLELDPRYLEARVSLGATYLYDPGDVSAGIKAIENVLALMPPRADIALDLLSLCVRTGDRTKVQAAIDGPIAELGDPATLVAAQERVALADLAQVNTRLAAGDFEGALEVLERSRDAAPTPRLRERFAAEIAQVAPVAARNRQIARYNESLRLAKAGDRKSAKAMLDALLAEEPDAELRRLAEDLLRQLR